MTLVLIIITAYLIGSLPIPALLRWRRVPLGVPPAGVYRFRNLREALVLIGLQMGKGILATLVGLMFQSWTGAAFAAAAVVLGDLFPIFHRSGDGRGVAVAAGALVILSPLLILSGAVIYLVTLLVTRYLSVSAVLAALGVMMLSLVFFPKFYVVLVVFFAGGLVLIRHRRILGSWRKGAEMPLRWRRFRRWK
ncbi:glycerol-3-phosphate acyltransferase PlsY [Melghirimyces profundicolus]|uniref:Glycerol-3-phosphate acyltransferase PlsY n=1 Tax=Melghirimyces profundicolus TaxID=1242148 RepID=A0A2T6B606_9BACL|nr:glycerol-3-phosphate acyltransferase [Melghirimyces profundicolus]PTX51487.1 glycerol-3-phosphate acyltransferase PlsY [Melghirimyces profundicolus]